MSYKVLFTISGYEFRDDGTSYDVYKATLAKREINTVPWTVDFMDKGGDDATVFWVWDDGTRSVAGDEIQRAYLAYVNSLIVEL